MAILSQSGLTFFNGTSIESTTNYIYTSIGSTGADDGWKQTKTDHVLLQTCVATLSASHLYIRVEGKYDGGLSRAASILATTFSSEQSIDSLIEISEKVKEIRVGVKADSTNYATPNNYYAGLCLCETK